ncbi:hypothetical protein AMATHDRAFT_137417 [Amanita thiersii Skay4041]|uniref:PPM-type phosphatase domain-containing protein n=1 Tax=Amanita thiersii Skay4041 TaxID=703135 RepID=A0A2A9NZR9_9AGAR|nr:hypothetical protein AMATHDRAFT_137417 [Amanita thiersii Skay4041]
MLIERSSYGYAYPEDIPGSRCGPEDGPWPRPYKILQENQLWSEFSKLARPQSFALDSSNRPCRADCVNFQPSPRSKTQDRYVATQLDINGRMWTFTGVFDGHLGDVTVEHVAYHLPIIVRNFLQHALDGEKKLPPALVSDLFSRSIIAFDDAIANDVLDLFGGLENLDEFSDAQIRAIINDQHNGGTNWKKTRLCMYGTTALVALVDPEHRNLWVANLGDCQAVLVAPKGSSGDDWDVEVLTMNHNGDNDCEIERVRKLHPGESECVVDRRVLGALAPFRCLGDVPFKQPPVFSRRILYNLFPGFHDTSPWEEFLVRNLTPPYITAEPEVIHRPLDHRPVAISNSEELNEQVLPHFLILASDGFTDLCGSQGEQVKLIKEWASNTCLESLSRGDEGVNNHDRASNNMAMRLLRRVLGEDCLSVSRVLTLDMETAWIDDTTAVVQTL